MHLASGNHFSGILFLRSTVDATLLPMWYDGIARQSPISISPQKKNYVQIRTAMLPRDLAFEIQQAVDSVWYLLVDDVRSSAA